MESYLILLYTQRSVSVLPLSHAAPLGPIRSDDDAGLGTVKPSVRFSSPYIRRNLLQNAPLLGQ